MPTAIVGRISTAAKSFTSPTSVPPKGSTAKGAICDLAPAAWRARTRRLEAPDRASTSGTRPRRTQGDHPNRCDPPTRLTRLTTKRPEGRCAGSFRRQPQSFAETLVLLPGGVADAIIDYYQTFDAISAPPDETHPPERFQLPPELLKIDDPHRAQQELVLSFARLWGAMRKQIGTDPLSEQTMKLLGPLPSAE